MADAQPPTVIYPGRLCRALMLRWGCTLQNNNLLPPRVSLEQELLDLGTLASVYPTIRIGLIKEVYGDSGRYFRRGWSELGR